MQSDSNLVKHITITTEGTVCGRETTCCDIGGSEKNTGTHQLFVVKLQNLTHFCFFSEHKVFDFSSGKMKHFEKKEEEE